MDLQDKTNEQLTSLAAQGDQTALELLIQRNLKLVYGFSYGYVHDREDASDVTQEIFVKVWKNLSRFDQTKPFKPWLYQIAKNTCLDFLKKKNPAPFSALDTREGEQWLAETLADTKPGPAAMAEQSLTAADLNLAIKKLEPKYAEIINLRFSQDLNFREIARRRSEPLNTIKSRCRRAVLALKKVLLS